MEISFADFHIFVLRRNVFVTGKRSLLKSLRDLLITLLCFCFYHKGLALRGHASGGASLPLSLFKKTQGHPVRDGP